MASLLAGLRKLTSRLRPKATEGYRSACRFGSPLPR